MPEETLSDDLRRDIELAAQILKEAGATEVYLFGSVATGKIREGSDIDLAVRGLPPERFFATMSQVTFAIERPLDLIDLDEGTAFAEFLIRKGKLRRVG